MIWSWFKSDLKHFFVGCQVSPGSDLKDRAYQCEAAKAISNKKE
jgi:hypothetical protein